MFHLKLISGNSKTGPIPVSSSTNLTCPDACSFKKKGCYGLYGPLAIHWRRIAAGNLGTLWSEFVESVKYSIRPGQLWRHNQVGDLIGENNEIDGPKLKELVSANKGKKGFTYTHKPVLSSDSVSKKTVLNNKRAIAHANKNGFTINLSADNIEQADEKKALNIAPVVVVVSAEIKEKSFFTPQGNKVVICPQTYRENVTCANCQLCQRQRSCIVGFPAHGTAKKHVSKLVSS